MIEIDVGTGWPEFLAEFLPRDHLARVVEQHAEDAEGLVLQPQPAALLAQLAGPAIDLEYPEAEVLLTLMQRIHGGVPPRALPRFCHRYNPASFLGSDPVPMHSAMADTRRRAGIASP